MLHIVSHYFFPTKTTKRIKINFDPPDIIASYTEYVFRCYGCWSFVYFDGYGEEAMSTKWAEQTRRAGKNTASDILFNLDTKVTYPRDSFLANNRNTTRLIS